MEQDAPPPPCTSSAAAVTGVGDPSSSLADTLRRRLMSTARPVLHSSPSPLPPPPPQPTTCSSAPVAVAGVGGDPSSSSAAHALRRSASSAQPDLTHYSSPSLSLVPPPPPTPWSSESASASAPAAASQLAAPPRSLGGHQGQSNYLFGVAPSASQQHSSFLSPPGPGTMGNALSPHLGASPSLLGGQQQQALPRPMTPGMLLGQRDSFCGFGRQPMLDQESSSRSAGLPPRWQPSHSRTETNPTFGSVQPDLVGLSEVTQLGQSSSSSGWESRLQLGGGAHTLSAWSTCTSGVVSNDRSSAAIMSTEPWHCRNYLSGESSSTMSSMPKQPSVGDKGSPGPPPLSKGRKRRGDTFTDAEMEKIRKEKRLSDLVITDPRRVKTILCNRASAKKSAERRESYRRGLQQQLQALDIEYTRLHGLAILQQEKLTELESQTTNLRMRLEDLGNEMNLKDAINETLVSSIQSITLSDSNARSGLPQQMSFDGQCSNGGQYQQNEEQPIDELADGSSAA